jgi:DNA-binding NarL/FixJ family response regulator
LVTIVIADDHPIVRKGLKSLFETEKDFSVVAEANDGFEAVNVAQRFNPNVVVLDLILGDINGIEVARELSKNLPRTGIVIYSMLASDHYVMESFKAGARGYVSKDSSSEELIRAIREVAAGKRYLSARLSEQPSLGEMITTNSPDFYRRLTAREREVFQLSAQGLTCAEIARRLNISRRTAEAHRANMMRKLGFSRPAALYNFAFQHEIQADTAPVKPGTAKKNRKKSGQQV